MIAKRSLIELKEFGYRWAVNQSYMPNVFNCISMNVIRMKREIQLPNSIIKTKTKIKPTTHKKKTNTSIVENVQKL